MNSIFFDAPVSDDVRRGLVYRGQLLVYSACPSALAATKDRDERISR